MTKITTLRDPRYPYAVPKFKKDLPADLWDRNLSWLLPRLDDDTFIGWTVDPLYWEQYDLESDDGGGFLDDCPLPGFVFWLEYGVEVVGAAQELWRFDICKFAYGNREILGCLYEKHESLTELVLQEMDLAVQNLQEMEPAPQNQR